MASTAAQRAEHVKPENDTTAPWRANRKPQQGEGGILREGDTAKERPCLMCTKPFPSKWSGERVCKRCKSGNQWREGLMLVGAKGR